MHLRPFRSAPQFFFLALIALSAFAQQSATLAPAIPSTGFAGLDDYRARRIAVFTDDYGQLARYRKANAELKPPSPAENRCRVFSATPSQISGISMKDFPGKPYVNRGIGGRPRPRCWCGFARMS